MTVNLVIVTCAGNVRPEREKTPVTVAQSPVLFGLLRNIIFSGMNCCGITSVCLFRMIFSASHLTPTTCTPSSFALSSRRLQSLREQPNVMPISSSGLQASVDTCSSSLGRRMAERAAVTDVEVHSTIWYWVRMSSFFHSICPCSRWCNYIFNYCQVF